MPIKILYDGKGSGGNLEPEIDIIAIHGLNPFNSSDHGIDTWRKPAGSDGHLWLRDSLPKSLPTARTMLYTYNSSPVFGSGRERFVVEASQFLESLAVKRDDHPDRPIILIGHSLGGILIKQVLVNAHANPKHTDIINSTFALVFMGTPHSGPTNSSKIAFGKTYASIVKRVYGNPTNDLMAAVENGSLFSDILKENWRHPLERYQIISCFEAIREIVPYDSAILGLPGDRETILRRRADHSDICRFDPCDETDAEDFEVIEGNLKRLYKLALKPDHEMRLPVSDSERKEVLESLRILGANPRYSKIEREHYETLNWIWRPKAAFGPGFLDWLQSDEGLFWIIGKPGAGKSTLVKYIHEHQETLKIMASANSECVILISFFFHELGIPSERTLTGLLHALLLQLLTKIPELIPIILPRFRNLKIRSRIPSSDENMWTEIELYAAFCDILKVKSLCVKILCIVDGLDECEEKSLRQAGEFLSMLATSITSFNLRFKVLCSSRPENAIELKFSGYSLFKIQDFTAEDIRRFVYDTLEEVVHNLHPNDPAIEVSRKLIGEIVSRAEGVFIWARLVVTELIMAIEDGSDDAELNRKLEQLPSELEELYARILLKVPLDIRHHTFNYLQNFARILDSHMGDFRTPSTLLGMVLSIQPSKEALTSPPLTMTKTDKIAGCIQTKKILQSRCRGFINLPIYHAQWGEKEVLKRFCNGRVSMHKTVKDYLFTGPKAASLRCGINPDMLEEPLVQRLAYHFRILKTDGNTKRYLVKLSPFDKVDGVNLIAEILRPFFVIFKAKERDPKSNLPTSTWLLAIEAHLKTLFISEEKLEDIYDEIVARSYASFERYAEDQATCAWHSDFMSVALYFGVFSHVRDEIEGKNIIEKAGRPYLHDVLSSNDFSQDCLDIIRMLVPKGCRPDHQFNYRTTWEYFLIKWYKLLKFREKLPGNLGQVAVLFLELGADPNQQVILADYECLALHVILSGHIMLGDELEFVLTAFLQRGADPNVKDSKGFSAIQLANENWPCFVGLLRRHAQTNATIVRIEKVSEDRSDKFSTIRQSLIIYIQNYELFFFFHRIPLTIEQGEDETESSNHEPNSSSDSEADFSS